METNYKDAMVQSLKDELERVRAERDALREKLEQVEEACNRLEDEVADRRKDVEARDRIILELSRPSSCEGDLISRSALVDEIERTTWYHINELGELGEGANSELHTPLYKADDVYNALEQAPTVDAVEVVRCKDCKHRRIDEDYASGHYCVKRPSNGGYFCEDNDFCSYGERRTDG